MWMSSSSLANGKLPSLELGLDRVEARAAARRSSAGVEHAERGERPGVGPRLRDVVGRQPPVERRSSELMPPEERVLWLRRSGTWSGESRRLAISERRAERRRRPGSTCDSVIAGKNGQRERARSEVLSDRELALAKPNRSR